MLIGCSTSTNNTYYPYEFNKGNIPPSGIKNIVIASNNYNMESRHYLKEHEEHIDLLIKSYLEKNKLAVSSAKTYEAILNKVISKYGDLHNPETGNHTPKFKEAMSELFQA